jgi:hypothetical protein
VRVTSYAPLPSDLRRQASAPWFDLFDLRTAFRLSAGRQDMANKQPGRQELNVLLKALRDEPANSQGVSDHSTHLASFSHIIKEPDTSLEPAVGLSYEDTA